MFNSIIETLNSRGDAWAFWFGTSILDAAIVLALAAALWTVVRKRASVQLGYCLFLLVLVKLFVPLEVAVPPQIAQWTPSHIIQTAWTSSRLSKEARPAEEPARESASPRKETGPQPAASPDNLGVTLQEYPSRTPPSIDRLQTDEETPMEVVTADNVSSQTAAALSPVGTAVASDNKTTYPSLLTAVMLLWAIGACSLAIRLISVQIRFHRRLRNAKPVDVADLPVDFAQLCARIGLKRPVRFIESDAVVSPAVWGIRRPVVILPQDMCGSLTEAQLEWILLHELAHIRRHDLAVNCFQRLVTILHFINPAVWLANRMINRLREYACDDVASALTGGARIESGEAFLGVVRHAAQDRSRLRTQISGALGAFDSSARTSCFQRMTRLLDTDRRLHVRLGLGSICALLLTALLTLPDIRAASQTDPTSLKPRFDGIVTTHVDKYRSGTGSSTDLILGRQMRTGFDYPDSNKKKTDWTSEIHWELTGHRGDSDVYRFRLVYTSPPDTGAPVSKTKEIEYDGKAPVVVFEHGQETVSIEPGSMPLPSNRKPTDPVAEDQPAVAEKPTDSDNTGRRFELIVVGPDGEAVPNARIQVRRYKPKEWTIHAGAIDKAQTYGTLMNADPQGRLAFDLPVDKPISLALNIQTDGYGPFWAQWQNTKNGEPIPDSYTAHLDAGLTVGGIIVDEQGNPIEGVEIHPSIEYKKREEDLSQLAVGTYPKTDSQGKWSYSCVPASMEKLSITINHPRFKPLRKGISTKEFTVKQDKQPTVKTVLEQGLVITGKVTDADGKALAGAFVRTQFNNQQREAKTGPDGAYTLVGCEPVRTAVVVTAKGYAPDLKSVLIASEGPPVDFTLQPGRKIRVRVVDSDGNPIPRTRIFFQDWRGDRHDYELDKVLQYADENGVWEWNDAPADAVVCDICPPGGMTLGRQTLLARDEEYVFTPPPALVITGRVLDAQTKQPIDKFRVVPGVRFANSDRMHWNRKASFTVDKDTYQVSKSHPEVAHLIRIEAEGYQPAVSRDIKNDEGSVTVDFELQEGANVDTQVLSPDGTPAGRAEVALGTPDAQIFIRNAEFFDVSTYCDRRVTDDEGRFSFPPQETPFELVILHSTGYAQVQSQPDAPPKTIRLLLWARVEGTLHAGTKPVAGEEIELNNTDIPYRENAARISVANKGVTDNDGRFTFDRVIPGKARIGQVVKFNVTQRSHTNTGTHQRPIDLPPGKTIHVELGGTGRPVVAKLFPPTGLDVEVDWNFAYANVQPTLPDPPEVPFPDQIRDDKEARTAWWIKWSATDEGKAWLEQQEAHNALRATNHHYASAINPDGTFRIDDVPPDEYELTVWWKGHPEGGDPFAQPLLGSLSLSHIFTIHEMPSGRSDQPLDLGELTLVKSTPQQQP